MAALTAAMNAFLSKVPGCWASMASTLAALACPATSSVGGSAASWASLTFDAAGGCAFLPLAKAVTLPLTWSKAGSSSGLVAVGGAGGCSSLSAVNGAGTVGAAALAAGAVVGPVPDAAALPRLPTGLAAPAPALPNGLTGGTGFAGGTGFFAATDPGPKPVFVTASANAGGFGPSKSTGTPAALAALSPFSTASTAGPSRRTSLRAASISV